MVLKLEDVGLKQIEIELLMMLVQVAYDAGARTGTVWTTYGGYLDIVSLLRNRGYGARIQTNGMASSKFTTQKSRLMG